MKKSLIASILIALLLLTSCTKPSTETPNFGPSETTTPAQTEPSLLIVNTTDDVDDGVCNTVHCSLREAINASNKRPGPDTITFDPSVFPPSETVLIELTSTLPTVLDGNTTIDTTGAQVTVDGSILPHQKNGLVIESSNNTVKGIRIQNVPGIGIWVFASNGNEVYYNTINSVTLVNCGYGGRQDAIDIMAQGMDSKACFNRIVNCTVENNADDGIEIVTDKGGVADNNLVVGSIFRGNAECGIEIDAKSVGCSASNNEVINNVVEGNEKPCGIHINSSGGGAADGNTIDSNTVTGNAGSGIGIATWDPGSSASTNVIVRNTVEQNKYLGIAMWSQDGAVANGNCIKGNTIKNHDQKDDGVGLLIKNVNDNLVYHNNFIENYIQTKDDGNNTCWEHNGEGNYWSDYTGKDANGDGIGDTPYKFTKGVDNHPLMKLYGQ